MVIKVQFYNIAPEGAILHLGVKSDLVNRAHKLPILGLRSGEHIKYH